VCFREREFSSIIGGAAGPVPPWGLPQEKLMTSLRSRGPTKKKNPHKLDQKGFLL